MAFLPKQPLALTGGCFCKVNRYTIRVPEWKDRPLHPTALPTPISATDYVETRLPVIDIDHCNNCRQTSGAIFQVWFICPATWVEWDMQTSSRPVHLSCADAVGPVDLPPETALTRFSATERATRTFCSKCGTNLTYFSHKRFGPEAVVDIAVGSMDQESLELCKPDRHGWWEFGTGWIQDLVTKGDGGLIKHQTGDMSKAA